MIPALATHIWQSTAFALLAALLTLALRKNQARVRHWIWLAASVKFLIAFSLLVNAGSHLEWRIAPAVSAPRLPLAIEEASQIFGPRETALAYSGAVPKDISAVQPLLMGVWFCGSVAVLLFWWVRWRRVAAAVRGSAPPREGRELEALRRMEGIAGMRKPIDLVLCEESGQAMLEPGVVGVFRPVLCIPARIADCLTDAHVDTILAHELCHIRRRDNLAAAIHMVVEALFWFHPLVWWLGSRMLEERERACDEEVLRLGSDPEVYAESILQACRFYLESPVACVSGVTGSDLNRRIEHIITNSLGSNLNVARKALLGVTGLAAVAIPIGIGMTHAPSIHAQSPAAPAAFEVASIKPHRPEPGPLRSSTGVEIGRINFTNVTLKACIRKAYGIRPSMISGGPAWLASDTYDITAKANGPATEAQMMPMLQTLLAERFKLAVHHETKEFPIYALVVDKNGPKIHAVKDDGGGTEIDGDDQNPIRAKNISMKQLAGILSGRQMDRPVFDQTGLNGVFNIALDFSREGAAGNSPDIFIAVQEQLGLKLVPTKGPVDTLVIDHAEKPSEN